MKKSRIFLVNLLIVVLISTGVIWVCSMFIHFGGVEYTDNAQVEQEIVPINSRIRGYIKKIYFDDFTHVHKGDTLVLVDDIEYRLQLAQAQANYKNDLVAKDVMGTTIRTTENNIAVSDASLEEVGVLLANAKKEYQRYQTLFANESVTRQQLDNVETQYFSLKAKYETMRRQQHSTVLVKSEQTQRLDQNQATIAISEAALRLAELNLSYTVITAPSDGFTSLKKIEAGALVQPGQQLLSIVKDTCSWVIANYRESQLRYIKIGSAVTMKVDAIPDIEFVGRVVAISKATGSQYSVVPQDNSTGNFVKVEQKIPVKIIFSSQNSKESLGLLHSGMNVECRVLHNK